MSSYRQYFASLAKPLLYVVLPVTLVAVEVAEVRPVTDEAMGSTLKPGEWCVIEKITQRLIPQTRAEAGDVVLIRHVYFP